MLVDYEFSEDENESPITKIIENDCDCIVPDLSFLPPPYKRVKTDDYNEKDDLEGDFDKENVVANDFDKENVLVHDFEKENFDDADNQNDQEDGEIQEDNQTLENDLNDNVVKLDLEDTTTKGPTNDIETFILDALEHRRRELLEHQKQQKPSFYQPHDTFCYVCRCHQFKYTCPGCQTKTCSLSCIKTHKSESKCDGTAPTIAQSYIPLQKYTDQIFVKDLAFLQSGSNLKQSSQTLATQTSSSSSSCVTSSKRLGKRRQLLVSQCKKLGINLKFMPKHFDRSQRNASMFDLKSGSILWTVQVKIIRYADLMSVKETITCIKGDDDQEAKVAEMDQKKCLEKCILLGERVSDSENLSDFCTRCMRTAEVDGLSSKTAQNVIVKVGQWQWKEPNQTLREFLLSIPVEIIEFPTFTLYYC